MNLWLYKWKTTIINVPRGTASKVQPFDVSVNKLFMNYVRELFEQHLDTNLEMYVEEKFTVREKHVLTKKWVDEVWDQLDVIKHSKNIAFQTMWIGVSMILWLLKALKGAKCLSQKNSFSFLKKKVTTMVMNLNKTQQTLNRTVVLIIS